MNLGTTALSCNVREYELYLRKQGSLEECDEKINRLFKSINHDLVCLFHVEERYDQLKELKDRGYRIVCKYKIVINISDSTTVSEILIFDERNIPVNHRTIDRFNVVFAYKSNLFELVTPYDYSYSNSYFINYEGFKVLLRDKRSDKIAAIFAALIYYEHESTNAQLTSESVFKHLSLKEFMDIQKDIQNNEKIQHFENKGSFISQFDDEVQYPEMVLEELSISEPEEKLAQSKERKHFFSKIKSILKSKQSKIDKKAETITTREEKYVMSKELFNKSVIYGFVTNQQQRGYHKEYNDFCFPVESNTIGVEWILE